MIKKIIILFIILLLFNIIISNIKTIHKKKNNLYQKAVKHSKQVGKPLIVIGAPNSFFHKYLFSLFVNKTYGCGNICIDLNCCDGCSNSICNKAEVELKKFKANSHIIFESGVIEVVNNPYVLINEMLRVAGDKKNIYSFHIPNNRFIYNIINLFYKQVGEGSINNFVLKFPPENDFKLFKS